MGRVWKFPFFHSWKVFVAIWQQCPFRATNVCIEVIYVLWFLLWILCCIESDWDIMYPTSAFLVRLNYIKEFSRIFSNLWLGFCTQLFFRRSKPSCIGIYVIHSSYHYQSATCISVHCQCLKLYTFITIKVWFNGQAFKSSIQCRRSNI